MYHIFAGFTACTSSEEARKTLALLVAISILVAGIFFVRRWKKDQGTGFSNTTAGKVIFYITFIPFLLFVSAYAYAMISPWCT